MHLAEFNIGVLRHDWDDPRIKDFADNLDRVNRLAQRAEGFVWRLPTTRWRRRRPTRPSPWAAIRGPHRHCPSGATRRLSTVSSGRPCTGSSMSVGPNGSRPGQGLRLVMWWVPEGHHPTIAEAAGRLAHLDRCGDTDHAFGWSGLEGARHWRDHAGGTTTGEA